MLTLALPAWSLSGDPEAAAMTYVLHQNSRRASDILPSAWVVTFGGKKTKRPPPLER